MSTDIDAATLRRNVLRDRNHAEEVKSMPFNALREIAKENVPKRRARK